jgi:membrane-associated protein
MDSILQIFGFESMRELVAWCGYIGLAVIVFAETGLLAGFFLPGDSLLVTAGLFAVEGTLDIRVLNLLLIPVAIGGDAVGYWFGAKTGPRLFDRRDSRFFKRRYLLETQAFYARHGGKTIVLARFMPIVRTFAPIVAGVAGMRYSRFAAFNVIGGIGWVMSMTLTGYFLGSLVPGIERHIEKIIVLVVVLSVLPGLLHLRRGRTGQRRDAPDTAPPAEPVQEPEM